MKFAACHNPSIILIGKGKCGICIIFLSIINVLLTLYVQLLVRYGLLLPKLRLKTFTTVILQ